MASRDRRPNLPGKGRNTENYRPETGIRQHNPRECRGFSHTGKYHPGDPTAWLTSQSAANPSQGGISLPFWKMQGEFEEMQRGANCNRAKSCHFSMACMGLSLLTEQGDIHCLAGTFGGNECRIANHI
jgi:hypothetical protein